MNKEKLKKAIVKTLAKLKIVANEADIELVIPGQVDHGNFTTNYFLKNAKRLESTPMLLAEKFVKSFKDKEIEKVQIAGAGFVNFYEVKDLANNVVAKILKEKDKFGKLKLGNGQTINFEFVSANPTGYLHVGHARGAAYGDTMIRLLEFVGYKVIREYWLNDYGVQIRNMALSVHAKYMLNFDKDFPMVENGYNGYDIYDAAEELYKKVGDKYKGEASEEAIKEISEFGMKYFVDQVHNDLRKINIKEYDHFSSEKDCYESGQVKSVLERLTAAGGTYEKDGALWLKSSQYGDDKDRVLIKSDKETTYLVADIAGHDNKYKRNPDQIVNIFGADHHGYEVRLKASQEWLGHDSKKMKTHFIQMVRLIKNGEEFKMSKRKGTVVTLREITKEIGVNELRYFMIYKSINQMFDLDFDFAKTKDSSNPVYYSLYAYARACQLINKVNAEVPGIEIVGLIDKLVAEQEIELLQNMNAFSQAVERSVINYDPSTMTNYIFDLAKSFHSFYGTSKIMGVDKAIQDQRYSLVVAFKQLLANAFKLIGVSPSEKM